MIRWGEFLDMLKQDGVSLETAEHDVLTEDGERFTTQFLIRWVDGRALHIPVNIDGLNEPVSRQSFRQIANVLRLPPERYIFPPDMR
ncbi:MAG: hypothetical protein ACE37H_11570 [Phycisphaeraceae bacterium]